MGGVTVNVNVPVAINGQTDAGIPPTGYIQPGADQHLDGYHALWYARSRANSTNYERMARQRCVVTSMVNQLDPQTVVLHFADIAKATKGVFRTDIPQEALASLATLAVKTKTQKITAVNFVPPLINPWDYDPQVVRDTVASTIDKAEKADERKAASSGGGSAASGAGTGSTKPKKQAVMERPGTDPDANTSDLASICSAG